MNGKHGTLNDIDTCSVTDFGKFDFTLKISADTESRYMCNHPDINDLMSELV